MNARVIATAPLSRYCCASAALIAPLRYRSATPCASPSISTMHAFCRVVSTIRVVWSSSATSRCATSASASASVPLAPFASVSCDGAASAGGYTVGHEFWLSRTSEESVAAADDSGSSAAASVILPSVTLFFVVVEKE